MEGELLNIQRLQDDAVVVVTIRVSKIISDEDIRNLKSFLVEIVEQGMSLILDCSPVTFMSSFFLATLIMLDKKTKARNRSLILLGVIPDVYEVFAITRMNRLFRMADSLDEALEML